MKPDDLALLERLAQQRGGLSLRGDKAFFAESRLAGVARREGAASVEALLQQLRQTGDERLAGAVVEALAVTDTAFFRDGEVFQALATEVLPGLAALDRPAQVWSAGCSTGQEAYSLAMLAADHPPLRLEIVATDFCERVLEKAHSGLYTQFEVQRGLPIRLLLRHFEKAGEMWAVSPRLKADVRWRRLNLAEERRSVRRFDLVLCRHVLCYLHEGVREKVLARLAASLASGGRLVLGPEDAPPSGFEPCGPGVYSQGDQAHRTAA